MSSFRDFWLPSMHDYCRSAHFLADSSIAWLVTSNTLSTKLDYFKNNEENASENAAPFAQFLFDPLLSVSTQWQDSSAMTWRAYTNTTYNLIAI